MPHSPHMFIQVARQHLSGDPEACLERCYMQTSVPLHCLCILQSLDPHSAWSALQSGVYIQDYSGCYMPPPTDHPRFVFWAGYCFVYGTQGGGAASRCSNNSIKKLLVPKSTAPNTHLGSTGQPCWLPGLRFATSLFCLQRPCD